MTATVWSETTSQLVAMCICQDTSTSVSRHSLAKARESNLIPRMSKETPSRMISEMEVNKDCVHVEKVEA